MWQTYIKHVRRIWSHTKSKKWFNFEFCATRGTRGHACKLFKSHCNSGVYVANSLPKELSKFGIHCRLLLTLIHSPYLDRVSCGWFFRVFKGFLIFQFVSHCYLLYCLDTGTRLTTVFFGNCVLGYKGSYKCTWCLAVLLMFCCHYLCCFITCLSK